MCFDDKCLQHLYVDRMCLPKIGSKINSGQQMNGITKDTLSSDILLQAHILIYLVTLYMYVYIYIVSLTSHHLDSYRSLIFARHGSRTPPTFSLQRAARCTIAAQSNRFCSIYLAMEVPSHQLSTLLDLKNNENNTLLSKYINPSTFCQCEQHFMESINPEWGREMCLI